jgi:zinc protease
MSAWAASAGAADGSDVVAAALRRIPPPDAYRLENGLQVIVQPLPWQSQVGVVMSYRVGARDEPPGLRGLAHLVEHMTYRGSRHLRPYGALALMDTDAGVGGGYTSLDRTCYTELVPAFALPHALWLEGERMAFTLERFSEESLAAEKRAVENEYRLRRSPSSQFSALISQYLFAPGSSYATPLDYSRYTAAISLDDVRRFFQNGHRPENALLVVTGGVDRGDLRKQVELYLGSIWNPRNPLVRPPATPIQPKPAHRLRQETTAKEQRFTAVWIMPGLSDRERASLDVLSGILRRRLDPIVGQGLAESIAVDEQTLDACSLLSIGASLNLDQEPGAVEARVRSALERLWGSDLEAALRPVKDALVLREMLLLERPLALALASSSEMSSFGHPHDVGREVALLRSVTVADLRALGPRFAHPMFAWLTHAGRPSSG